MRSEHQTYRDAELNRNALRAADNSTIQTLDPLWVAADTLSPSNSHCTLQDYDCNTKTDWHVKYYISVSTWQNMSDLRRWGHYFILFSHLLMPPPSPPPVSSNVSDSFKDCRHFLYMQTPPAGMKGAPVWEGSASSYRLPFYAQFTSWRSLKGRGGWTWTWRGRAQQRDVLKVRFWGYWSPRRQNLVKKTKPTRLRPSHVHHTHTHTG